MPLSIDALFNAVFEQGRRTRSRYHLTLGQLVKNLEALAVVMPESPVNFDGGGSPGEPHSDRGYYEDLAFTPTLEGTTTVAEFLQVCRGCLGKTFEGYKGGDFTMAEDTPLWCAAWGACGRAVTRVDVVGDRVVLETKEVGP